MEEPPWCPGEHPGGLEKEPQVALRTRRPGPCGASEHVCAGRATPGLGRLRSAWDLGCWVLLPTSAQRVGFWRCWGLRPCGNMPGLTTGHGWEDVVSAGVRPVKPMDRSPAVAQPCRHWHLQAPWPRRPVPCSCQPELGGTAHGPDTHPLLCHQPAGPQCRVRASQCHRVSHPSWSHAATLLWVCSPNMQALLAPPGGKAVASPRPG